MILGACTVSAAGRGELHAMTLLLRAQAPVAQGGPAPPLHQGRQGRQAVTRRRRLTTPPCADFGAFSARRGARRAARRGGRSREARSGGRLRRAVMLPVVAARGAGLCVRACVFACPWASLSCFADGDAVTRAWSGGPHRRLRAAPSGPLGRPSPTAQARAAPAAEPRISKAAGW